MVEEGPTMDVVVIFGFVSTDVGVGVVEGIEASDCGASALLVVLLLLDDFETSVLPTPPPTAAATTMIATINAIHDVLRRKPHIVLAWFCSSVSVAYGNLCVSVSSCLYGSGA
jgi:hypothetical protein